MAFQGAPDSASTIAQPPDPLRPLTADEVEAVTDHSLFRPVRPWEVPQTDWPEIYGKAIEDVRQAAQTLNLDIPFPEGVENPVTAACDLVTQQAIVHPNIEKRLLGDKAVHAVRAEIGFFLGIRWNLSKHPQFQELLEAMRQERKLRISLQKLKNHYHLRAIAVAMSEIAHSAGNIALYNIERWQAIEEFLLEQAGLIDLMRKPVRTDSFSRGLNTGCAQVTEKLTDTKRILSLLRAGLIEIKTKLESGRCQANFRGSWEKIAKGYFRFAIAMGVVQRFLSEEPALASKPMPAAPQFTFSFIAERPVYTLDQVSMAEGRLAEIEAQVALLEAKIADVRTNHLVGEALAIRHLRHIGQEFIRVNRHLRKAIEFLERMTMQEIPPEAPKPTPPPIRPSNPSLVPARARPSLPIPPAQPAAEERSPAPLPPAPVAPAIPARSSAPARYEKADCVPATMQELRDIAQKRGKVVAFAGTDLQRRALEKFHAGTGHAWTPDEAFALDVIPAQSSPGTVIVSDRRGRSVPVTTDAQVAALGIHSLPKPRTTNRE
ncbi:hypothetical protein HZA43_00095 [Candidatus Peregrinibacteria bacterium]|nr:hypothetical protein [Candidatus Peregrinibacteria bacterium]